MKAEYDVVVDGESIASTIEPVLHSIRVSDKAGTSSDTASVVLDNRDGQIEMPPPGAQFEVYLGWKGEGLALVFSGTVDDLRSAGGRSSGRVMTINAKGFDTSKLVKQPHSKTFSDMTIEEILIEAGSLAGITDVRVDYELADIKRKHEVMDNESFAAFGERLAKEIGGTFKLRNDAAVMAKKGSGRTPAGEPLPTIDAEWGSNLHGFEIAPYVGRHRYSKIIVKYHDLKAGKWKQIEVETNLEGAEATQVGRFTAPNKEAAKQKAESLKAEAEKDSGAGRVTVEGNVSAMAEGTVNLIGAGQVEDGEYRIDGVDHNYSRGGGFVTACTLAFPLQPNEIVQGG